ncbi:hypothetical protein BBJ29_010063, partial [Phytophthora kernoviae]
MKVFSTMTAATVTLVLVSAEYSENVERKLVIGGQTVPVGTKTYTTGIRSTVDGDNICGGSLISPTHVLTSSQCSYKDIRWVSVGSHFLNGTQDGEQIKVVSIMNHPKYDPDLLSNDFMILELQKPTLFTPVTLAAADDSDYVAGEDATVLGWGYTTNNGPFSYELNSVDVPLWNDQNCTQQLNTDPSMLCAGGVLNKDVCVGDGGSPLIISSSKKDILLGLNSWGPKNCGTEVPSVYSRVSNARAWIDS